VDLAAYAGARVRVRFRHFNYYYYGSTSTWSVDEINLSSNPTGVASIAVTPTQLQFRLHPNGIATLDMTIANNGQGSLSYSLMEASGAALVASGTGAPVTTSSSATGGSAAPSQASTTGPTSVQATDIPWLSESVTSGDLGPGQHQIVTVTGQAPSSEGTYLAYLVVSSNDPARDLVAVPVEMISSNVLLVTPTAGDTLRGLQTVDVSWDVTDPQAAASIDIELSTDAGNTFGQLVVTGYSGAAPYHWTVPNVASDSCILRLTSHTTSGELRTNASPGVFTIVPTQQTGVGEGHSMPTVSLLRANTPNPFGKSTRVPFDIAAPGMHVRIVIYDVRGAVVRVLRDGWASPGRSAVAWDCRGEDGAPAPAGIYFCCMTSGTRLLGKTRLALLR
jgi:hypothetical protein